MKKNKGKIVFGVIVALAAVSLVVGFFSKKVESSAKFSVNVNGKEIFNSDSEEFDDDDDFDDFDDDDFDFENDSSKFERFLNFAFGTPNDDYENAKIKSNSYISSIYITGVISEENRTYNQKWLLKQIKKAQKDSKNVGILLVIDSPGGTVYEADDAYLALENYKKATGRPVYAYFCSLAASGGYYIGCAADEIFANRNTLTGSIGVIAGQSVDATGLFEKLGIKMTTITAGKNKNMGNYDSVLTDEQRAIFQAIADEAYEQFTGIVADSRKMDIDDVKKLADGRVYTAQQAKNNGLIDEICSMNDAKEKIRNEFGKKIDFIDFKYVYEESFLDLFSSVASFVKNPQIAILSGKSLSGKVLYLYE